MKFASSFLFLTAATATVSAFAPATNSNSIIRSSALTSLDLAVGETAPDFELVDQNGKTVKRSTTFKNKPLVVYFYPADSTPGCTIQAQTFDSKIQDIRKKYGADVVGISGQDVESKQKFASELGLSFSILADTDDQVRKAFGVPRYVFFYIDCCMKDLVGLYGVDSHDDVDDDDSASWLRIFCYMIIVSMFDTDTVFILPPSLPLLRKIVPRSDSSRYVVKLIDGASYSCSSMSVHARVRLGHLTSAEV